MNILTPTGNVPIEDISVGDEVIGWNFDTNSQETNVVEAIDIMTPDLGNYEDSEFCYYKVNDTWTFFTHQTVMINGGVGWHAFELNVGDTIYDEDGNPIEITSIDKITNNTSWVRFQISGDHAYIQDGIAVHNAARFWVTGGVDDLWGTIGNWSTTSGGGGGSAVPTSSDAVTMDANSTHNCTLNASSRVCASIVQTNWGTRTFTFNQILTVSGNITIPNTITTTGAASLKINATGSINIVPTLAIDFFFAGTTLTCTLSRALAVNTSSTVNFASTGTLTMAGAFSITGGAISYAAGTYTLSGAVVDNTSGTTLAGAGTGVVTLAANSTATSITVSTATGLGGSFNYTTSGNLTMTAALTVSSGTPVIVVTGGTWSGTAGLGANLTFNGSSTISGTVLCTGNTITYTSGTITTTGSTVQVTGVTFNCSSITFNNIQILGGGSNTLSADVNISGATSVTSGANSIDGAFNWNTVNLTMTGGSLTGGSTVVATGTWSGAARIGTTLTLAGATISGSVTVGGGTLNHTGTVTVTSSTVSVSTSETIDAGGSGGLRLNNLSFTGAITVTLSSDLFVDGTLTNNNNVSMAGTGVWTAATLSLTAGTLKLVAAQTYTCTSSFTGIATTGSHFGLACVTVNGTKAIFTMTGTSQNLIYIDGTDVDSSAGFTIYSAGGTLTRTINWSTTIGTPVTTAYTFSN